MLDPSIKNARDKKRIRGKKQKWSIKNNAQVYKKQPANLKITLKKVKTYRSKGQLESYKKQPW